MQVPWIELGITGVLIGALGFAMQSPAPVILPEDAPSMEGRHVAVAGFVEDVQIGVEGYRGTLVANGHALWFRGEAGTAPEEGEWVELEGTIHRIGGYLTLSLEERPWRSSSHS